MLGFGLGLYWKLTWGIIVPVALLVIFIYSMAFPDELVTDDGKPLPPAAMGMTIIDPSCPTLCSYWSSWCLKLTACGWILAGIGLVQIPGWGLWTVISQQKGLTFLQVMDHCTFIDVLRNWIEIGNHLAQKFKASFRSSEDWGPKSAKNKKEWLDHNDDGGVPFHWMPRFLLNRSKAEPGVYKNSIFKLSFWC